MNKYEISVWNDIYNSSLNRYTEEKLMVIGSDTMTSQNRALEPNLKSNVNGTNVFNFYLYYDYIDNRTGERIKNPFVDYLTNERKIKVYWEDKWYDLLIKQIVEDTAKHTFTYTCEDQYLTELSRNGFELEFQTELQNNIGTASELVKRTLEKTDWQFLDGDNIYQETEEPVYEVEIKSSFIAKKNPKDTSEQIISGRPALVYYSCAPDLRNLKSKCQFYYSGSTTWQQDVNNMLVINGNCYTVNVTWQVNGQQASAKVGGTVIFTINFATGLSRNYRAKRYVQSQKTIYNNILERYVNVYNYGSGHENLLGYETTEYNDALAVVNLVTNPSNFTNMNGWTGTDLTWKLSPSFNENTDISIYKSTSFLYLKSGYTYNNGIQSNCQYLKNGLINGERYIFRIKAKKDGSEPANTSYVIDTSLITPEIRSHDIRYIPGSTKYFSIINRTVSGNWLEFEMECTESVPYNSILSTTQPFGIFIKASGNYWLEEAQFFKKVTASNGQRINPGEMQLQSIAQPVWKYFMANQPADTTKDTLEYIYTSQSEWASARPVYNNYEKFASIEISQSNCFNILQTIAESFECWVKFIIEHDEQGYIKYINGAPCKYVQLKKEIGEDTGLTFVYGIDLQSIKRNIKSSSISTKTIVKQNSNEFGKNGFCSIARSTQNYPRENFIYNFDYFVRQGLLNGNVLNNDLYGTTGLAYYSNLHNLNTEYMNNLEVILNKKNELVKQTAMAKVYSQYVSAAQEEFQEVKDNIVKLAGVEDFKYAYDYIKNHSDNEKVKALMNDKSTIDTTIKTYQSLLTKINQSIQTLTTATTSYESRQKVIINRLKNLNIQFYKKYSRYIQEGTWSSEDYYDDDLYYLDALQVAYTSSRPQISYDIKVVRLSGLEEFSSKSFNLGNICYIQDPNYFGYLSDGLTPYKEAIYISEITSYFDSPEKDTIVVQNYKTQFDDLFQRITAATQQLEFSEGKYNKAANIINTDSTIKSSIIQSTFDSNADLVYSAQNESVLMDNTGITVTNNEDAAKRVKITSGGIFVSNDGGISWKNAVRGDGITADVITAGKLNVEQVIVYGRSAPSFFWDEHGINAYEIDDNGSTNFSKYVRFDKYGMYGIKDQQNFVPTQEEDIYNNANFGFTWSKFFMKNTDENEELKKLIEISTDNDILVKVGDIDRIRIGRIHEGDSEVLNNYGMQVKNNDGDLIFQCDDKGAYLAGWELGVKKEGETELYKYLKSKNDPDDSHIEIRSNGWIGCVTGDESIIYESTYEVITLNSFQARNMRTGDIETIPQGKFIYIFTSYIGDRFFSITLDEDYNSSRNFDPPSSCPQPKPKRKIQFQYGWKNMEVEVGKWDIAVRRDDQSSRPTTHVTQSFPYLIPATETEPESVGYTYKTTYTYHFNLLAQIGGTNVFNIAPALGVGYKFYRYVSAPEPAWVIDQNGDAAFHKIQADWGEIAGWFIDKEKIYQTYNGERNGRIKTQLNSKGAGSFDGYDYSIITDAIQSAMATIGNVVLADGLINGQNIVELAKAVQFAIERANSAYTLANNAYGRANEAYNHLPIHNHGLTYSTRNTFTGGDDHHYHEFSQATGVTNAGTQ